MHVIWFSSTFHPNFFFVFSDEDVWLKSGRIIGEEILEKHELFNLAMDGVTAVRASDKSCTDPYSFSHAPIEVKQERFANAEPIENPEVQPEATFRTTEILSSKARAHDEVTNQVTDPNVCNDIEESPNAHIAKLRDRSNLLNTKIEMPSKSANKELSDNVSLNDESNIDDENVPTDDITSSAPIQDKELSDNISCRFTSCTN